MNELVKRSRFVTISSQEGGVVVEANLWLHEEQLDAYTVNIRAWGKTVESATEKLIIKLRLLKVTL